MKNLKGHEGWKNFWSKIHKLLIFLDYQEKNKIESRAIFIDFFRSEGQKVKIGRHKKGAWTEIGQNRIRGGWGVKKTQKTSDIIYVRSLIE